MRLLYKIFLFAVLLVLLSLVLPALFFIASAWTGIVLIVILFFIVMPFFSAFVGGLAATDMKRLFWMPLAQAIVFPLLFSLAAKQFIWELYIYSLIYLLIGALAFVIVFVIKLLRKWEVKSGYDGK